MAILVLGMHRSGTSCLAGMLTALGCRPPGPVVRNWDNRHGHFEATAAIRLNEAVLAHSGGHFMSPPATLRWTDAHADERDRLLAAPDALIKDPRSLLCLPFWRDTALPLHLVGIVRHPLAVARSLASWRQMPLDEGLGLWLAHNRPLRGLDIPLLDFDAEPESFCAAVADLAHTLGLTSDPERLRAAYDPSQVHHDGGPIDGSEPTLLAEALRLHQELLGTSGPHRHLPRFPWPELRLLGTALDAGDTAQATQAALAAVALAADPAAAVVPAVAELLRRKQAEIVPLVVAAGRQRGLAADLAELLYGKACLARNDSAAAIHHLEQACAVPQPYWEARHLLAQALYRHGLRDDGRRQLESLVEEAIYPHRLLAELAEWDAADGDTARALSRFGQALDRSPPHRRGRLRSRRAELLLTLGDRAAAIAELRTALVEDPQWSAAQRRLEQLS